MKNRFIAGLLVTAMVFTLVGCGNKNQGEGNSATPQTSVEESGESAQNSDVNQDSDVNQESDVNQDSDANQNNDVNESSVSAIVQNDFNRLLSENRDMSAEDIAVALCENPQMVIGPVSIPVEEGLLNGFGNTEIKGFKEGATFAPMIGAIPFLGYVFVLEDDTDVEAFMNLLKDNADLRWNVCTTADEMVVSHVGQTVLFVMCPTTFEE